MLVVMRADATREQIEAVIGRIKSDGYDVHLSTGVERTLIGIIGESPTPLREDNYSTMDGVDQAVRVTSPFKLAGRNFHPEDSTVHLKGVSFGSRQKIAVIAGPCSVESREQIIETAHAVREAGATALRGGAFKPRSSPYSFQGHGELGLEWLAEAREQTGLAIVTEVMDPALVPMVAQYADMLQIGARNMQNYTLLNAVGVSHHPILLKRGMMSTIEELLMSAEYILAQGNWNIVLCERGIRTFEKYTRNTFDLNAIPVLKDISHLPVIADPSHAVGKWEYVEAVARSAIAAGADGLIVEVHPRPDEALSDGRQSLTPKRFKSMMEQIRQIAQVIGRGA
ncbi:MAG: 3-deoxy-7-phosphoheptulonate synthase [Anaerolineae bacterium]|nr:3-deoxy-7-phosphoheptulonate synthase [Anaerolineae bacterium]